jgi:hypothetical protein
VAAARDKPMRLVKAEKSAGFYPALSISLRGLIF